MAVSWILFTRQMFLKKCKIIRLHLQVRRNLTRTITKSDKKDVTLKKKLLKLLENLIINSFISTLQ